MTTNLTLTLSVEWNFSCNSVGNVMESKKHLVKDNLNIILDIYV